jgi:hypothetical protein
MYVTYYSIYDNQYYNQQVSIANNGTFSFTYTENYYANVKIFVTDNSNLVYEYGYIESNLYTISNIAIGFSNTTLTSLYAIQNLSSTLTFNLIQWNASYPITSLYIYIGTSPQGSNLAYGYQYWNGNGGGGTRSNTLLPLTGIYSNLDLKAVYQIYYQQLHLNWR